MTDQDLNVFVEQLELCANSLRGHRMTEEQWLAARDAWVDIGAVLAPCRPTPQHEDGNKAEEDAYDIAMSILD